MTVSTKSPTVMLDRTALLSLSTRWTITNGCSLLISILYCSRACSGLRVTIATDTPWSALGPFAVGVQLAWLRLRTGAQVAKIKATKRTALMCLPPCLVQCVARIRPHEQYHWPHAIATVFPPHRACGFLISLAWPEILQCAPAHPFGAVGVSIQGRRTPDGILPAVFPCCSR